MTEGDAPGARACPRPRCAWLLALVLAACGSDPTLHVTVHHPDGIAIARTVVSVYESDSLTCDQVAYGDVTGEELQATLVASVTLAPPAPPQGGLDGLSRVDPKIIVARGYGSDGTLLAAGCAEKGTVTGDDEVTVTTELAATASVRLADPSRSDDIYGLAVTTTGPDGKALDGREVWWRVYGPAGTAPVRPDGLTSLIDGAMQDGAWQPAAPACASSGVAKIHPVPPDLVGGYAIDVRVAWAAQPVSLISALTSVELGVTLVNAPLGVDRFCALGRDATGPAVVCLEQNGTQRVANAYRIAISGATATFGAPTLLASWTPPQALPFAVFAAADGSGTDVYAALPDAAPVEVLGPGAGTALPCTGCSGGAAKSFDDVLVAPACGSQPAMVLLHDGSAATLAGQLRWLPLAGGTLAEFPLVATPAEKATIQQRTLNSAGCATRIDPSAGTSSVEQVIAIDLDRTSGVPIGTRAQFACGGSGGSTCEAVDLPVAGAPVGFTGGVTPELIATGVDATGVVLSTGVLASVGGGNTLLELARQPAASLPHRLVAGQLDDDGGTDLVFDVASRMGSLLDLTYSREVAGAPLAALSPALRERTTRVPIAVSDLFVADLDGNGIDDLVLAGHTLADLRAGLSVVLLGVPAPLAGNLAPDPPCAP